MATFINIITLMFCAGAMSYCYILGKQVRSLKNMRDGVGVLIEDMIKTTQELQFAFENTKDTIQNEYDKLNDKIDEGASLGEYLDDIIIDIKNMQDTLIKNQSSMRQETHTHISPSALSEEKEADAFINKVFDNQQDSDPLADVVPKGLGKPIKRAPPVIIPGEEYL